jgi:hypothetical protein
MNNFLTGTPAKAIRKPTCMLPNDLLYLHEKDTSTKNVKCNEIGEYE